MKPNRLTTSSAGLSTALGLAGLAGSILPLDALHSPATAWIPPTAATAAGFAAAGAALLLLHCSTRRWTHLSGLVLAFGLIGGALVSAARTPAGPARPDLLLEIDFAAPELPLLLTGLALLALRLPRPGVLRFSNWLGIAVAGLGLVNLVARALPITQDHRANSGYGAALWLLLGVGLACAGAETGFLRRLSRPLPLGSKKTWAVLLTGSAPIVFLLARAGGHSSPAVLALAAAGALAGLLTLGGLAVLLQHGENEEHERRSAGDPRNAVLARLKEEASAASSRLSACAQSLSASSCALELALRAGPGGLWQRDLATGITTWDENQLRLCGLQAGEFDGRAERWLECVHPGDRARVSECEAEVAAGGGERECEFRLRRADGAIRFVRARVGLLRDASGQAIRLIGLNRDETAERESDAAVTDLAQRLEFALEAAGFAAWELHGPTRRLRRRGAPYGARAREEAVVEQDLGAWLGRIHPEDRPRVEQALATLLAGEAPPARLEYRVQGAGGATRQFITHCFRAPAVRAEADVLLGFDRDATAEHELRTSLEQADERCKLALAATRDAVWDRDFSTGISFRDSRFSEILGYPSGALKPEEHDWHTLAHPDDVPHIEAAINDHLNQRTPDFSCEYRLRHRDGHWHWCLGRGRVSARDAHGRALRITGTLSDIHPRKVLEEKLRHSEELFLQLGRLAQIGAWEWDLHSGRLTWSAEMYRIHEVELGYEPTLHKALAFFAAAEERRLSEAFDRAVSEGTSFDLELPFTTALGRLRHARVLAQAEVKNGRTLRLYGAFQDITQRREAEQMRSKLEAQLFQAQKMETLGTLAGGIAHDFNNLLTGILGYQELAQETLSEQDPARSCLEAAREASLRARELVDQILTFSRQAGSEKIAVNLGQVVEEARRFLRATVPATIRLELDLAPQCGRVLADSIQIHQILLNLGSNAAHAMRAGGGVIRLGLAPVQLDAGSAAALHLKAGGYVRLTFSDTGHGMDQATLKRIWDPFFTTKEVGQGTGLGLSVVHGIIEAHRGTILVDSAPGQGTTFTIYLPVTEEGPGSAAAAESTPRPGAGERIAVIDDDDTVCRIAQAALLKAGYRPVLFHTPEECLQALRQAPGDFALLLTDQTMPAMKGVELAAEVRGFAPRLPVLIMSGYFSRIAPEKLAQIGRVSLLPKPFTSFELAGAVARAVRP